MNKIQRFPQTVGTAVNVTDPTSSAGTNATLLNTALSNIASGMLTDAQKAYLDGILGDQAKAAALAQFAVTTTRTVGSDTYYADEYAASDISGTVQVRLTFRGTAVDATATPSGWTKDSSATGVYTKNITTSSNAAATNFTIYVTDSISGYTGNLTKSSSAMGISYIYPKFYGWSTTTDCPSTEAGMDTLIAGFTKSYNNVSLSSITNNSGSEAYLWIVTRGSANVRQLGNTLLLNGGGTVGSSKTIHSTISGKTSIEMGSYKVYRTSSTVGIGKELEFSTFSIS